MPRKDVLSKFGITDRPDLQVLMVEKHGLSVVDVRSPEDPGNGLSPKQATELSALLRKAGEEGLGRECGRQGSKDKSKQEGIKRPAKGSPLKATGALACSTLEGQSPGSRGCFTPGGWGLFRLRAARRLQERNMS